jgi:hypothetical protein
MAGSADTVYGRRPWGPPPTEPQRIPQTHEQYLTGLALESAMAMTADQIRLLRPPVPVQLFPPRFGYRTEELGIEDIVNLDYLYQRTDFAQNKSGMEGTSTPSLNVW